MKHEIEQALRPMIGEPLTAMWRYAGNQKFEFGVQRPCKNRKGEEITRADLGLVVSCQWRLEASDGGYISSDDYGPEGERYRDEENGPVIDRLLCTEPIVQCIAATVEGGIHMSLSSGYSLNIWPCGADAPEDEQWRFMPADDARHFVVLASGIEE